MSEADPAESFTVDDLDRQIVQALQLDGRAPLRRIADVLKVSDQTVARRFRRLRGAGMVRVVGATDTSRFGFGRWFVQLRCTPDAAAAVAAALARREDTSWVHLLSGGTEISCSVHSWTAQERDSLLLQKLPRTAQVLSITAHNVLHVYLGGTVGLPGFGLWHGRGALTDAQMDELRPPPRVGSDEPVTLEPGDRALLEALARDGRGSHAELATIVGTSESTVRRRMEVLRSSGVLYFDVDVTERVIGRHSAARLSLSVAPSALPEVGEALADHAEVVFAAATTGRTNLLAVAVCRDDAHLYRYLTERAGALPGITRMETAPVIRTLKRVGAVNDL